MAEVRVSWDDGKDDDRGNRSPRSHERPPAGAKLGDAFDGAVRGLDGMTYRHPERGDTILVEYVGAEGSFRLAMPPEVADTIARQRDALTTKNRKRGAKQAAETRKAAGIEPAFLRRKK